MLDAARAHIEPRISNSDATKSGDTIVKSVPRGL